MDGAAAGAFGNLRDTLAHVADVDLLWLARSGRRLPATVKTGDPIDLVTLAERRRAIDDALVLWTEVLGEDDLDQRLAYVDTEGVARETPLGLALAHMFDHQTFHRGEASAILTALGQSSPSFSAAARRPCLDPARSNGYSRRYTPNSARLASRRFTGANWK